MRNEILRMEHILCESPAGAHLNYLSMQVFEGEIYGVLVLEQPGIDLLVELICRNRPLAQGRIYYREKLVNRAGESDGSENPVTVVGRYRNLFPELTIADNLFTAQGYFRKYVIPVKMIRTEARHYLREAGLELGEDQLAKNLTEYESIVIEILSAIIQGVRLIILWDTLQLLSVSEQKRLGGLLRRWSKEGFTFLLIYGHHEVLRTVCDRIAFFKGETIQKIVSENEKLGMLATTIFARSAYSRIRFLQKKKMACSKKLVLTAENLKGKYMENLSFEICAGENVLFYGRNSAVLDELGGVLTGGVQPSGGAVQVHSLMSAQGKGTRGISAQRVLLPRDPTHTLLFPEMSALENFCLPFAERMPGFWMKKTLQRSVMNEYNELLGGILQAPDLYHLSSRQLYDLLYLRYLLSMPQLLICIQPLLDADMNLRTHILSLMLRLQESGIAILVLNTELYDTIYIADRVLQQLHGGGVRAYNREEFDSIREQQGTYYPD